MSPAASTERRPRRESPSIEVDEDVVGQPREPGPAVIPPIAEREALVRLLRAQHHDIARTVQFAGPAILAEASSDDDTSLAVGVLDACVAVRGDQRAEPLAAGRNGEARR